MPSGPNLSRPALWSVPAGMPAISSLGCPRVSGVLVIGEADHFRAPLDLILARRGIGVVGVDDIDEIVAAALQQLGVQRHAEEPFMLSSYEDLVDGGRYLLLPSLRIDAGHALARPLSHPEMVVGPPGDFPWPLQSRCKHLP